MPDSTVEMRRLAYSPSEAGAVTGLSRQTIYDLMARGELRSIKIGRSRRILAIELDRFLNELAVDS